MKKTGKYILLLLCVVVFNTCKKKTSIRVRLFNPALNEYVANAKIVLIERKGVGGGGFFGGGASCKEIAEATTDRNGECFFDKEKLRTSENYFYFCSVKESWGVSQYYTCAGRTSGFIDVGKNQDIIASDDGEGYFQVQYNNLLNPSQPNDSLIVSLQTIEYKNTKGSTVIGGGGVFAGGGWYLPSNPPPNWPSVYLTNLTKTKAQRLKRSIRKRKLGVVTTSVDTIKVYPNQTITVVIDW